MTDGPATAKVYAGPVKSPPTAVWVLGAILGLFRLGAFLAVDLPRDHAQWQLNYLLLWLLDVPWSFIYFFVLPPPIGEMFLGPIWWGLLPYLVWKELRRRAARRAVARSA